jgi:subtilase family serine protease
VAIVDAYDDPKAEADLAVYRSTYGLPPCTTANGCFRKVNQTGGTTYPTANTGWAEEIALDLDMASAVCPNCKILLVEASSNSLGNLLAAENEAATLGANVISNSWGASEFSSEALYDGAFNHGIPITASTGDSGYGVSWPAASPYVTAVGGTHLVTASNGRGWSETAWSGAGSGCSGYEPKPSWQSDSGCTRRTVADVSAVADPNTGVAVYDTYNVSGWLVFGGTSVSAPIVAATYALAGNGATISTPSYSYAHTGSLFDVTSGSNGSCGGSYLCTAVAGYDGPTGFGTPNGTSGF